MSVSAIVKQIQTLLEPPQKINTEYNHILQFTNENKIQGKFAILKIYTSNQELKEIYETAISKHNNQIVNNTFPDSGFDLFIPNKLLFDKPNECNFVDLQIKTEMLYHETENEPVKNTGYHIYPRSSFSKTPLVLGNHVGIVDSGYRGNLIGAFKYFPNRKYPDLYEVEKHNRLLQICHPSLCPIFVILTDTDELTITERGDGGFGSTGL